jgi:hypothetical protein
MSKRKDRERFAALKTSNPHYQGFRGQGAGTAAPSPEALRTLTCTVCGRRRNVTEETARDESDSYVCLSCRDEAEQSAASDQEAVPSG